MTSQKQWFIKTQSGRSGPFEFQQLQYFADRGKIKPNTAITSGDDDWVKAKRVDGLYFPGDPPPGGGHEERSVMPDSSVDGFVNQSSPFGIAPRDSELSGLLEDTSGDVAAAEVDTDDSSVDMEVGGDLQDSQGAAETPGETNPIADAVTTADESQRASALTDRESELATREAKLAARESELASRESALSDREANLARREAAVRDREAQADSLEMEVRSRESDVACRESDIDMREQEVTRREAELRRREAQFINRETERAEQGGAQENSLEARRSKA